MNRYCFMLTKSESNSFVWNKPNSLSVDADNYERAISIFLEENKELKTLVVADAYNDLVTFTNSVDGGRVIFDVTKVSRGRVG